MFHGVADARVQSRRLFRDYRRPSSRVEWFHLWKNSHISDRTHPPNTWYNTMIMPYGWRKSALIISSNPTLIRKTSSTADSPFTPLFLPGGDQKVSHSFLIFSILGKGENITYAKPGEGATKERHPRKKHPFFWTLPKFLRWPGHLGRRSKLTKKVESSRISFFLNFFLLQATSDRAILNSKI